MSTTSVESPSGSVQITHNYNTRLIHDVILLLFQSLLLFLRILREILPVADTTADPFAAAGDSTAAEHSALLEHIVAVVEPSTSDYTVAVMQTVATVQIAVAAVVAIV